MSIYTSIKERVLSDENIFLAVYLANSYIQNVELLSKEDRNTLESIKDIYCEEIVVELMKKVKTRISSVLERDEDYFEICVYLKPKKREEGVNVFRPLHTANLVDQISIIAMAQILIYDYEPYGSDCEKAKLVPSELSRLIPSNFYGNRVSYCGTELFKPWQEQYHKYTSKANDRLYEFSQTREYKYEIDLDLQNFFPSIDPKVLYGLILSKLPLRMNEKDRKTIKTILKKLLFFHLIDEDGVSETALTEVEWCWYLKKRQMPEEISRKVQRYKVTYAKGLPQGLPHTYFLGNLMMLAIRDIYKTVFPGEMLFYVDDSVIFTNNLENNNEDFDVKINEINEHILKIEDQYRSLCKDKSVYPKNYTYQCDDYGIRVHDSKGKSTFALISEANKNSGEVYLSGICRETSALGADIYLAYSDDDVIALLSRTKAILRNLEKEIINVSAEKNKIYYDKLIRYKKFFKYRETILNYRCKGDLNSLKVQLLDGISMRTDTQGVNLKKFFDLYTDDIFATLIPFVLKKFQEAEMDNSDLRKALNVLDKALYGENNRYSYIQRTCKQFFEERLQPCEVYASLRKQVFFKYGLKRQLNSDVRKAELDAIAELVNSSNEKEIFSLLELEWLYSYSKFVRGTSAVLERKILNAIFSFVLGYDISDNFIFSKTNRDTIQYSDLRILASLRNPHFMLSKFKQHYYDCVGDEFRVTADYSILQVMEIFKTFVVFPDRIDQLILIHKYCCDTWKNGSKFLYFYTLHNQEHAVTLIQNARKILSSISWFELKTIDYFILFAACYLHDISMVSFPDYSSFYIGNSEASAAIFSEFSEQYDKSDVVKSKKALCKAYQDIDGFFEQKIRDSHAFDSANEIRTFAELSFLEPSMRELIARVAGGHGQSVQEVYYSKSEGQYSLVSEKLDKIILRLSDLLDMSRYRISKIIFDHNLHNINKISRFHWISHLLTDGYTLNLKYTHVDDTIDDKKSYIDSKCIIEKVILTVNVLMSQTTTVSNSKRCMNIADSSFSEDDTNHTTIVLKCGKGKMCQNESCNFLCKWFMCKNTYLVEELAALQSYLNSLDDNFYKSEIEVRVKVLTNNNIPNEVFDYLHDYIEYK